MSLYKTLEICNTYKNITKYCYHKYNLENQQNGCHVNLLHSIVIFKQQMQLRKMQQSQYLPMIVTIIIILIKKYTKTIDRGQCQE